MFIIWSNKILAFKVRLLWYFYLSKVCSCKYRIRRIIGESKFWQNSAKTFWRIKYWRISHSCIHIPMQEYYWWIKYWQFYPKSLTAKIYSSPIFHLIRYSRVFVERYFFLGLATHYRES